MVAGLGLGVFGAALATLIAQGISAVFSLLIFFNRMRRYKSRFNWFDRQELHSMLRIAVPSVLQQSTVSIGMMIVQAVVNPFGTQALAGYAATMRVENVFSLIFVSIGNAVSPYVSQNLGVVQHTGNRGNGNARLLGNIVDVHGFLTVRFCRSCGVVSTYTFLTAYRSAVQLSRCLRNSFWKVNQNGFTFSSQDFWMNHS